MVDPSRAVGHPAPALLPADADLLALIAIAVLLVGVPLFVVAVLAVVTGYVRHDSERFLAELEAEDAGGRDLETASDRGPDPESDREGGAGVDDGTDRRDGG